MSRSVLSNITAELRPLAKHLQQLGVTLEQKGSKVQALDPYGNQVVWFSTATSSDVRSAANIVAQIRRKRPELVEDYRGIGSKGPSKKVAKSSNGNAESTERAATKKNTGAVTEELRARSNATRIRLRTGLADQFDGKVPTFIEWALTVGKELGIRTWPSAHSAEVVVYGWLKHEDRTASAWSLDLVDAALDAAYGTPTSQPAPEPVEEATPEPEQEQQTVQEPEPAEEPAEEPEPEPEPAPAPPPPPVPPPPPAPPKQKHPTALEMETTITRQAAEISRLRARVAHYESTRTEIEPRQRYVELLFALAEKGDSAAMDRIERLI